jgi:hypothetical protein
MSRVLLVNMPFGGLRWPNLGLSLLKAALAREDIACDVAYFNFELAELLGVEHYHWLADQFAFVLGGERLFAKHYFADRLPADADYYREVLLPTDPGMRAADYQALLDTARHIGPFLEGCLGAVDWSRYAVVGFTASFQLTGIERAVYLFCDTGRTLRQIVSHVTATFGAGEAEESVIEKMLDAWVAARLTVHVDGRYLGLAIRAPSSREEPAE